LQPYYRYIPVEREGDDHISADQERRLFDRILKYTGVFGSVQGVTMMVTLVINMVKSRLLGPVGYGITESLNRSADLVKSSTNLGIATLAVPEISRHVNDADPDGLADKVRLTRSWALLTALLGMVACLILAPFLSRWAFDGDSGYTVSFMVLSLAVAAAAVTGGETAVLKGAGILR
jgi:O-antigen/teichoic acid export membrane protein